MPQVSANDCIPILADKARGLTFQVRGLRALRGEQTVDQQTRDALWLQLAEVTEQLANVVGGPQKLTGERIAKVLLGGL